MDTSDALLGLDCTECGERHVAGTVAGRCPDCDGALAAEYDYGRVSVESTTGVGDGARGYLDRSGLDELLPLARETRLEMGQGGTPLRDAPSVAADLGVAGVAVKGEGCNPTGSLADREMALAVAAARTRDGDGVGLPTTGSGGRAAAAAAAGAGTTPHVFVPSRAPFLSKAMINVHGGDMNVVEGRYPAAREAFESATAGECWRSLAPFDSPYRHEGLKPVAYEIVAARGWRAPDRVVVPTGQVTALVGLHRGFRDLVAVGLTDEVPTLVAAQASGCAPLVRALESEDSGPIGIESPDTVCGFLEVPRPRGSRLALRVLAETGGTAIAVPDEQLLSEATALAREGLPTSLAGGVAVGAVRALAADDALGGDEEIVLVDPVAADGDADLLRSHLMRRGPSPTRRASSRSRRPPGGA